LQVSLSVREQQRNLAMHATRLPLDGVVDKLCLVVLDILHQGRAKYTTTAAALAADDPFDALLSIGASQYRDRIATLRAGIKDLEVLGKVGRKVYDRDANASSFRLAPEARQDARHGGMETTHDRQPLFQQPLEAVERSACICLRTRTIVACWRERSRHPFVGAERGGCDDASSETGAGWISHDHTSACVGQRGADDRLVQEGARRRGTGS
jgi:hypothetical protein